MFFAILVVCVYLTAKGQLALPALAASAIIVFLGVNLTELHRVWQNYEVNPGTVIHTRGIISKKSRRIDLFAINSVSVHQTLYQRIFGIGDIHIHVANASHVTVLKNLREPKLFAQTIQDNMHKIRNVYKERPKNIYSNTSRPFKRSKKDDLFDDFSQENELIDQDSGAETSDNLQEI
jgi:uncharacterized membrane protein YdbT with pleckstrin-like domain